MEKLPRDVVQLIMDLLEEQKDFFTMRKVCMLWYQVSFFNQKHWYEWLQKYGKLQDVLFQDHRTDIVHNEPHLLQCTNYRHYKTVTRVPRILKTRPLYTQVFEHVLRDRRRIYLKEVNRFYKLKDAVETELITIRQQYKRFSSLLRETEEGLQRVNVKQRKRIRLNISKSPNE